MKKQQIDKSNFGYIGIDFQYKLTKYFIEENNFFEEIASIVDPNSFTDPILRKFVGVLKDEYHKNSIVPSYEMMGIILRKL
jgi:hypothetical protein